MLTGEAAAEAMMIYTRIGSIGARFDGAKVAAEMRSRRGRIRLAVAVWKSRPLSRLLRVVQAVRTPRPRRSTAGRLRGVQRVPDPSSRPRRPGRDG